MRKRYLRRILAMILSVLMIIGTVPTSVFAEGATESAENEEGTEEVQAENEEIGSDETENLENEVGDEVTEDKEKEQTKEILEEEEQTASDENSQQEALIEEQEINLAVNASSNGVSDAIQKLVNVYPKSCSYFTSDGKVDSSNSNSRCSLANIPSRGGLPSGQTVKNAYGKDAWSCHSFAEYAWYVIFGHCTNTQTQTISTSQLQLGDFIRFSGHSAIYLGQDSKYYYVYDSNWASLADNKVRYNHTISKSRGIEACYHATNYNDVAKPVEVSHNPIGAVDRIEGNQGSISVYGWAYDWDDINTSLEIHVYIGGSAGSGAECHVIRAEGSSPDLSPVTGNHRFASTIETSLTGNQPVYIYAINIGGGDNVLIGSGTVTIKQINNPIGAVDRIEGNQGSISVYGWAYDWDNINTSLEVHVYIGGSAGSGAECHVIRADVSSPDLSPVTGNHRFASTIETNLTGNQPVYIYAINIGSGDNILIGSGNVSIIADTKGPEISDYEIGNITAAGYTITCKVTDESGVDRVQFPTWTEYNGQDDLPEDWATNSAFSGTRNGDTFSYRVTASDHNNERGVYITHIYAYDKYGNVNVRKVNNVTMLELPQATTKLGDNFYAEVQNATTGTVLTKVNPGKFDAYFQEKDDTLRTQIWRFVRNKNEDSYTISCEGNEALVLDVEGGLDKGNNNVQVWTRNGSNAQKWKILEKNGNYYLQPLCSDLRVLDTPGASKEGTSAQIHAYNEYGGCGMKIIKTEPTETKLEDSKIVATASYKGHSYQIFDQGMSWSDAKRACEALGGHLVTITDSEEQAFVEKLLEDNNASMNQYWLGMFRYKQSYAWVTGENSDYTNWDSGEPNGVVDDYPSEYCVQLLNKVEENRRFKWNDKNNSNSETDSVGFYGKNKSGVICEFETLKEYTLSYNANGGSSAPEKEVETQGTELIISSKKPIREGYNFIGWATKSDATKAEYQAGDKYTLNGNITLYAVWEKAIGGTCGKEVTWSLGDDGTLTISGTGEMKNYTYKSEMPWYKYISQIKNVVIKEGVTSIGDYAFYGMTKLTNVTVPKGIISIGAFAFKNCTVLDGVQLPTTLKKLGESAFFGCSSLTEIAIPEGLYTVWGYTFKNCTKLEKVIFPSTLVKIDEAAFYGCSSLKTLTIPDNVSIIGIYCFKNCTRLSSVQLSANIQQIREAVFYGTAITELKVPDKVTSIGAYAFKNCTKLKNVTFSKNLTKIDDSAFYACSGLAVLNLPDSLTEIKDYAFRKCTELENVNFSVGLKTVGESSFYGCKKLTELNLPEGVTDIKGYAFKGCIEVTTITLPSTLKTMGESAFYGCTGISKIEIPKNVSTVGAYAFSRCSKLSEVVFKGNAPIIGNYAFAKVTAKVGYPSGNTTWNKEKQQNYGGTLTWSQTK